MAQVSTVFQDINLYSDGTIISTSADDAVIIYSSTDGISWTYLTDSDINSSVSWTHPLPFLGGTSTRNFNYNNFPDNQFIKLEIVPGGCGENCSSIEGYDFYGNTDLTQPYNWPNKIGRMVNSPTGNYLGTFTPSYFVETDQPPLQTQVIEDHIYHEEDTGLCQCIHNDHGGISASENAGVMYFSDESQIWIGMVDDAYSTYYNRDYESDSSSNNSRRAICNDDFIQTYYCHSSEALSVDYVGTGGNTYDGNHFINASNIPGCENCIWVERPSNGQYECFPFHGLPNGEATYGISAHDICNGNTGAQGGGPVGCGACSSISEGTHPLFGFDAYTYGSESEATETFCDWDNPHENVSYNSPLWDGVYGNCRLQSSLPSFESAVLWGGTLPVAPFTNISCGYIALLAAISGTPVEDLCDTYSGTYSNPIEFCGYTANQACSVCGGGWPGGTCDDSTVNGQLWNDGYYNEGAEWEYHNCAWYGAGQPGVNCGEWGHQGPWDSDTANHGNMNANEACCACGGGSDGAEDLYCDATEIVPIPEPVSFNEDSSTTIGVSYTPYHNYVTGMYCKASAGVNCTVADWSGTNPGPHEITITGDANFNGDTWVEIGVCEYGTGLNQQTGECTGTSAGNNFNGCRCHSQDVTVNVISENDAPVATNTTLTVNEDTSGSVTVSCTENQWETGTLTYSISSEPSNGSVTISGTTATYTPNLNYNGDDLFKFTCSDGEFTDEGTVDVTVSPDNDPATLDTIEGLIYVNERSYGCGTCNPKTLLNVSGTDSDSGGLGFTCEPFDTTNISCTVDGSYGTGKEAQLSIGTYDSYSEFTSTNMTVCVTDYVQTTPDCQIVTVYWQDVNNPPEIAFNPTYSTPEETGLTITKLDLCYESAENADGDTLTTTVTGGPSNGYITESSTEFQYMPGSDFVGQDTFTYTCSDGVNPTVGPATVTINVVDVNDPPTTTELDFTVNEDETHTVDLSNYCSDVEGNTLNYSIKYGGGAIPGNGGLITLGGVTYTEEMRNADFWLTGFSGALTYRASSNYHGSDSIQWKCHDGESFANPEYRTINITVGPVNDPPIISTIPDQTIDEDTPTTINLSSYVSQTYGETDVLTYTCSGNSNVSCTVESTNIATITLSPILNYNGTGNTISFTAEDTLGLSTTKDFYVNVTSVNDAPTLTLNPSGPQTINENATLDIELSVTDIDSSTHTFTASSSNTGLVTTSISGTTLTLTTVTEQDGDAVITVYATDDGGMNSAEVDFTLTVNAINEPPGDISLLSRDIFGIADNTVTVVDATDADGAPDAGFDPIEDDRTIDGLIEDGGSYYFWIIKPGGLNTDTTTNQWGWDDIDLEDDWSGLTVSVTSDDESLLTATYNHEREIIGLSTGYGTTTEGQCKGPYVNCDGGGGGYTAGSGHTATTCCEYKFGPGDYSPIECGQTLAGGGSILINGEPVVGTITYHCNRSASCIDYTLADGTAWHDAYADGTHDCEWYRNVGTDDLMDRCNEWGNGSAFEGMTANDACCSGEAIGIDAVEGITATCSGGIATQFGYPYITLKPLPDQYGTTDITISIEDRGDGDAAELTTDYIYSVNVAPVGDKPVLYGSPYSPTSISQVEEISSDSDVGCEGIDDIIDFRIKYDGDGSLLINNVEYDNSNSDIQGFVQMGTGIAGTPENYNYLQYIDFTYTPNEFSSGFDTILYECTSEILTCAGNDDGDFQYLSPASIPNLWTGTDESGAMVGMDACSVDISTVTGVTDDEYNRRALCVGTNYSKYVVMRQDNVYLYKTIDEACLAESYTSGGEIKITIDYLETDVAFGYDDGLGITIEQSLSDSHDPMSGISVITDTLQNTKQSIEVLDSDKRPSLGMFYYDDDNPLRNEFTPNLPSPFTQITKPNLIENGNGRMVLYNGDHENHPFVNSDPPTYTPRGWGYLNMSGVNDYYDTDPDNIPSDYHEKFMQDENAITDAKMYAGYEDYTVPSFTNLNVNSWHLNRWARWRESTECLSYGKCLKFDNDTGTASTDEAYTEINQYQKIDTTDILPFSSLNVSFWMKTTQDDSGTMPEVEAGIKLGADPGREVENDINNTGFMDIQGYQNSIIGGESHYFAGAGRFKNSVMDKWEKMEYTFNLDSWHLESNGTDLKDLWFTIQWGYADTGVVYLDNFSVTNGYDFIPDVDVRMKKGENEYGTGLLTEYYDPNTRISSQCDTGFWFTTTNGGETIEEAYAYALTEWETPEHPLGCGSPSADSPSQWRFAACCLSGDCEAEDVTLVLTADPIANEGYFSTYDDACNSITVPNTIQLEKYNDTIAPLEASFYFYPRYNSNDVFDFDTPITYNDFRNGMYYIYDVDWGDGSPNEFISEPEKLGDNKMIYHTYETSGIYEVTGTMLRMKPDRDYNPLGIAFNQRFTLRININEGLDEDFKYFGSDGFSFIPYKNTLPVIGGYGKESIYYKSVKRQLGFISDDITVDTQFEKISDKLKTEVALVKMESTQYYENEIHGVSTGGSFVSTITRNFYGSVCNTGETHFNPSTFSLTHPNGTSYDVNVGSGVVSALGENVDTNDKEAYLMFVGSDDTRFEMGDVSYTKDIVVAYYKDNSWTYDTNGGYNVGRIFTPNINDVIIARLYASDDDIDQTIFPCEGIDSITTYSNRILPYFTLPRFENQDGTGNEVYTGTLYGRIKEELGDSIGDVDITNIRYFNEPKQMYEMLGFDDDGGTPDNPTYWKNIIPKDYPSIFYRDGVNTIHGVTVGGSYDASITLNVNTTTTNIGELLFSEITFDFIHPNGTVFSVDLTSSGNNGVVLSSLGDDNPGEPNVLTDDKEAYLMFVGSDETRFNMYPATGENYQTQIIVAYYIDGSWTYDNNDVGNPTYDSDRPFEPNSNDSILARLYADTINEGISGIEEYSNYISIDTSSEQQWIGQNEYGNTYYYPVLPRYNKFGLFNYDYELKTYNYPNDNTPFPLEAPITNEELNDGSLKINITSNQIESNILDDLSGNQNHGFAFSDYRPNFDNQTLEPKKVKNTDRIRSSKNDGAF